MLKLNPSMMSPFCGAVVFLLRLTADDLIDGRHGCAELGGDAGDFLGRLHRSGPGAPRGAIVGELAQTAPRPTRWRKTGRSARNCRRPIRRSPRSASTECWTPWSACAR